MKRLAVYERREVAWLKGIPYDGEDGALAFDTAIQSTWGAGEGGTSAEATLYAVVRWHDVQAAVERVVTEKRDRMIFALRAKGFTEEEVAERVGLSRDAVRRRFKAKMESVLEELGGEVEPPPEQRDGVDVCLTAGCGRVRARLAEVRTERWTLIGWRVDEDGRLSQAWLDADGEQQAFRRRLAVARIGAVYEVTTARGLILRKPEPLPEREWLSESNLRVRAWRVDEQRAERGEPVPERSSQPQEAVVVRPERQAAVCASCLAPEHRVLLLPNLVQRPAVWRTERGYGSTRGARTATSSC